MTVLSANQVAAAAYAGGFRGNQIAEAVAVAYAESSWDTTNKNSCCHGLWQINIQAHPNMKNNVYDPVQNATYAHQIYSSEGGWCRGNNPPNCNPFQGYGNSNYKSAYPKGVAAQKYLEQQLATAGSATQGDLTGKVNTVNDILKKILGTAALGPIALLPGMDNPLSAASSALSAVKAVAEFINRMGRWITNPDNLLRILKVVAGAVVITVGAAALLEKQVLNMTPVGKVAKVATKVVGK